VRKDGGEGKESDSKREVMLKLEKKKRRGLKPDSWFNSIRFLG
jgi:hypothetical protein